MSPLNCPPLALMTWEFPRVISRKRQSFFLTLSHFIIIIIIITFFLLIWSSWESRLIAIARYWRWEIHFSCIGAFFALWEEEDVLRAQLVFSDFTSSAIFIQCELPLILGFVSALVKAAAVCIHRANNKKYIRCYRDDSVQGDLLT